MMIKKNLFTKAGVFSLALSMLLNPFTVHASDYVFTINEDCNLPLASEFDYREFISPDYNMSELAGSDEAARYHWRDASVPAILCDDYGTMMENFLSQGYKDIGAGPGLDYRPDFPKLTDSYKRFTDAESLKEFASERNWSAESIQSYITSIEKRGFAEWYDTRNIEGHWIPNNALDCFSNRMNTAVITYDVEPKEYSYLSEYPDVHYGFVDGDKFDPDDYIIVETIKMGDSIPVHTTSLYNGINWDMPYEGGYSYYSYQDASGFADETEKMYANVAAQKNDLIGTKDEDQIDHYTYEELSYNKNQGITKKLIMDGKSVSFLINEGKVTDTYKAGVENYVVTFFIPYVDPFYDVTKSADTRSITENGRFEDIYSVTSVFPNDKQFVLMEITNINVMKAPEIVPIETSEPDDTVTIEDEPTPNIDFPTPFIFIPPAALLLLLLFWKRKIVFHGALLEQSNSSFFVTASNGNKETKNNPETVQNIADRLKENGKMDFESLYEELMGCGYITKVSRKAQITVSSCESSTIIKTSEKELFKVLKQASESKVSVTVMFCDAKTKTDFTITYDFTK